MIRITFYRPRIFTREYWRERKQLHQQGFLDEETYSLFNPLANFILPRLKRFSEIYHHSPEWQRMLNKMVWSINEIVERDGWPPDEIPRGTEEEEERKSKRYYAELQEGLTLFGRYFRGLWW